MINNILKMSSILLITRRPMIIQRSLVTTYTIYKEESKRNEIIKDTKKINLKYKKTENKVINLEKINKIIKSISNTENFKEALTHSSYVNSADPSLKDYERLEFLGDIIISFYISNFLYLNFPKYEEGKLTNNS
jgi:dsRNA-specific ribonuclease